MTNVNRNKRWTLINTGKRAYLKFIDPEVEGLATFLEPSNAGYKVDCPLHEDVKEIHAERFTAKVSMFLKNEYPDVMLVRV